MKTYTESELQELLRQQRELCANAWRKIFVDITRLGNVYETYYNAITTAPSPLLPTEEKEDDLAKEKQKKLITEIMEEDQKIGMYDVPSDNNTNQTSLASHSCAIGNSIQQAIEMLSNAHNLLAKSELSMEDYNPISGKLASVKLELFELSKKQKHSL